MTNNIELNRAYSNLAYGQLEGAREILEMGLYLATPELERTIYEALEHLID